MLQGARHWETPTLWSIQKNPHAHKKYNRPPPPKKKSPLTVWHKIITYEKLLWNSYFPKITNFTRNSVKNTFFPGDFEGANSLEDYDAIISCQRVTPPPPKRSNLWAWRFSCRKSAKIPGAHNLLKLAQPFPAQELQAKHYIDMRLFPELLSTKGIHEKATFPQC